MHTSTYHISAEYLIAHITDFSKVKEKDIAEVIKNRTNRLRAKVKAWGQEKAIKATLSANRKTLETTCDYFTKLTSSLKPFSNITIH